MDFYAATFDGTVTERQTFGESDVPVPEDVEDRIFNSEVSAGAITIKASDDLPGYEVVIGGNVSLFVTFADSNRKREIFAKLAEGGNILFPIEDNFGMLVDQFGIRWMFVSEE
jgi:PhnB protein